MLDGRLYRAALVPLLLAFVVAGFSLTDRPLPLSSTLAPDAFDGTRAFADLKSMADQFPRRRPGGAGDAALATHISRTLRELGRAAGGGTGGSFRVSTRRIDGQTIDGLRPLTTVIAQHPGATGGSSILILAHRDAAARGSRAELSGTAVMMELARVFAQTQTKRTITLVSISGGSGGNAGAGDFATHAPGPVDAVIVVGGVAGVRTHKPFVVPFSDSLGSAPDRLQRTVAGAISQEVGANPGGSDTIVQLAHLAFPLTAGEQGPFDAHGLPAVLVQGSGERGPSPEEAVSQARLTNFGRAVLSAVYALDEGPDIQSGPEVGVLIQRKTLPEWAMRLLVAALLLGPLLVAVDGLARVRRRREHVLRWTLWVGTCALPFLVCALLVILLGRLGIVAAPHGQVPSQALPSDSSAGVAVALLGLLLAWLAWPALVRRLGMPVAPRSDAAGAAALLVLLGVAILAWLANPFSALLLVPALHVFLLAVSSQRRGARAVAFAAVAVALAPLVLLVVLYARELGLGPGGVAQSAVLLLAGGHVGVLAGALWSVALGCVVALAVLAFGRHAAGAGAGSEPVEVSIRGPLSYAGPGSLGGTESALRR